MPTTTTTTTRKQAAAIRREIRWFDREIAQTRRDAESDWDDDELVRLHFEHLRELKDLKDGCARALGDLEALR